MYWLTDMGGDVPRIEFEDGTSLVFTAESERTRNIFTGRYYTSHSITVTWLDKGDTQAGSEDEWGYKSISYQQSLSHFNAICDAALKAGDVDFIHYAELIHELLEKKGLFDAAHVDKWSFKQIESIVRRLVSISKKEPHQEAATKMAEKLISKLFLFGETLPPQKKEAVIEFFTSLKAEAKLVVGAIKSGFSQYYRLTRGAELLGDEYFISVGIKAHELDFARLKVYVSNLYRENRPKKGETEDEQAFEARYEAYEEKDEATSALVNEVEHTGFIVLDKLFVLYPEDATLRALAEKYNAAFSLGLNVDKAKEALAPNFSHDTQSRYHEFWHSALPKLVEHYQQIMLSQHRPLSKAMYQCVADKRKAIAIELGQKPVESRYTYGAFRHAQTFVDVVCSKDIRFGKMFAPMAQFMYQHGGYDKPIYADIDGNLHYGVRPDMPVIGEVYFEKNISQSIYLALENRQKVGYIPGIAMIHTPPDRHYLVYQKIDGLLLALNSDALDASNMLVTIGEIMWYLGQLVPLEAGSAAASENFIKTLFSAHGFNPVTFDKSLLIPWYFKVKIQSKADFAKDFALQFTTVPSLVMVDDPEPDVLDKQDKSTIACGSCVLI